MFEALHGRQLMLTDVIYQKPSKVTNWDDNISMVYRDLVTQQKAIYTIKNPTYIIYEVQEEYRTFRKARQYLPIEKTIPHEIEYKNRYKEIANIAGPNEKRFVKECKDDRKKQILYKYPYVLGADIPIETYYRVIWEKELGTDLKKEPTCIYLDIEINQMHWDGGKIPRHGEVPVDAVTVVDDVTNSSYTFLLHIKDNPKIDDFINSQSDFQKLLHETFDDSYGKVDYKIYMFEDELEMLESIFKLIHSLKRDFCLIWNMAFDAIYLRDRIYALGGKAEDVMCHSDFPTTSLYFHEDVKNFDADKRRDYFELSAYTHFLDQMIMYASLRKSQGALRKVNLGAIGLKELNDSKLDYTDVGNIVTLSYNDYTRYVLYNIKDVLLQMGINRKCRDTFNFYASCYYSYCQYKDGLKQTVSLRSFIYRECLEGEIILGNNVNYDNGRDDEEDVVPTKIDIDSGEELEDDDVDGAIICDPTLNSNSGLILFGKRSMYLFGHSIDFDFSAMYPNSILAFNIFAEAMIGKLFIEDGKTFLRYDDDPGKEFIEDLIANDVIFMGEKWFGLPGFNDLNRIVTDKLNIEPVGVIPVCTVIKFGDVA